MAERDDYSEYPNWMMGALVRDPNANADAEADNFNQRWGDLSSSATPSVTMSDPFELAAYRVRRSVPVATKPPSYAAGMQAMGDVAALLPMTKGVEGLQLLARTAPRVAGWLGAGAGLASAPGLIEPAKRAFEQSQSRLDTGEYDPEPVVAATMYGLSPQALYTSTAKEMQGTLGALGGRPPSPTASAFNTLQAGAEKASQDYTKSLLPPPTSFMDRIWNNYAKKMTPDELLQSEPLWGGAQQLAQATGMSESEAFAHVANNMFERMGAGTRLTPETANQIMGQQRGAAMLSDVLSRPQAKSGGMGDIADQQTILRSHFRRR